MSDSLKVTLLTEDELALTDVFGVDVKKWTALARWAAKAHALLGRMMVTRYVPVWIRMHAGDLLAEIEEPQ